MRNFVHFLFFVIFVLCTFKKSNGQIAITEVYYDTPFSEREHLAEEHHIGEYVELFNYTTEDIDISGWRLSNFTFPQGTIINSGDFLIVAYSGGTNNPEYFTNFFPNTQGLENKILYQNNFLLNNYKFSVELFMTSIKGIDLPRGFWVQELSFKLPKLENPQHNYYNSDTFDSSGNPNYDFNYYKKSLQLNNQNQFQVGNIAYSTQDFYSTSFRNATPMSLDYPVELVPLESIPRLIDAILRNYDHFMGNSGVLDLLNNICDKYVSHIFENVIFDDIINEKCPEYDEAGNFIGLAEGCFSGKQNSGEDEFSEFELEDDYASMIWLAPNPTQGKTTIYWEKDIEDQISQIIVVPVNGGQNIPINYLKNQESAEVNLTSYPSGIYVVRFLFKSGQTVTKSIIKI